MEERDDSSGLVVLSTENQLHCLYLLDMKVSIME